MHVVAVVILVVWLAFWVYWFVAAASVKKGHQRWGRFAGIRVVLVLVAFTLVRAKVFKGQTITRNPWLQGLGLAVFLAGLGLAIWARVYLGRNWGMPMTEKADTELVTSGPYRKVRHPIYTGILLAMVGTAVAVSWYWMLPVVLMALYFGYSAIMEERHLVTVFPEAYPAYQRTSKRIIPFIF